MELPRRKKNRLENYDYSMPGVYFVTICTKHKRMVLSDIVGDGLPVPKPAGKIAAQWIERIPEKYDQVSVLHSVVMPNHIHMLLRIEKVGGTGDPSPTLGNIIGWYKYHVTKYVNEQEGTQGQVLFQRSYHDHVVRGEKDYRKIWNYIEGNPMKWKEDCFYCK